MEEIEIELADLKIKKWEKQIAMGKPFEYGRSPGDNEYKLITLTGIDLLVIEGQIEVLQNVLDAIKHNISCKPF